MNYESAHATIEVDLSFRVLELARYWARLHGHAEIVCLQYTGGKWYACTWFGEQNQGKMFPLGRDMEQSLRWLIRQLRFVTDGLKPEMG